MFKAVPSLRSLVMLNFPGTRGRPGKNKHTYLVHRYSAAYQVAGSRYQRLPQQPSSSQAPPPPPPPAEHQHQQNAQKTILQSSDLWCPIYHSNLEWSRRKKMYIPIFFPTRIQNARFSLRHHVRHRLLSSEVGINNSYLCRACRCGRSDACSTTFSLC